MHQIFVVLIIFFQTSPLRVTSLSTSLAAQQTVGPETADYGNRPKYLPAPVCFAGDTIVREGTAATKMYFIHEGVVEVLVASGQEVVATLDDGSFFGETCLWAPGARRSVSVRAETYCNLFSLSADAFGHVVDQCPKFKDYVTAVLEERANRMAIVDQHLATGDTKPWHRTSGN